MGDALRGEPFNDIKTTAALPLSFLYLLDSQMRATPES